MFALIGQVYWAPVMYGLMPNKGLETYSKLYDLIGEAMANVPSPNVPGQGLTFRPDLRVMADFETAERRPWSAKYPSHNLKVIIGH